MNLDFWNGKRVLVTGHTGFKGGWLSLWLHQLGARVVGYSLAPPTTPSLFDVARVADGTLQPHRGRSHLGSGSPQRSRSTSRTS